MLFELVDVFYHRMMLRSHKWYRNAVKKMCDSGYTISSFEHWYINRLYQLHVLFKNLYRDHVCRPMGHALFLLTMDEVFSNTNIIRVLWPKLPLKVGVKNEAA